jgi:hypothetical protein
MLCVEGIFQGHAQARLKCLDDNFFLLVDGD